MSTYATGVISKDPDADLDYGVTWADWLAIVPGDTIATSEWIVPALSMTAHDESHTDTTTTVWFSGGTLDARYTVVNRITTAQGRTEDKTLNFAIRQH